MCLCLSCTIPSPKEDDLSNAEKEEFVLGGVNVTQGGTYVVTSVTKDPEHQKRCPSCILKSSRDALTRASQAAAAPPDTEGAGAKDAPAPPPTSDLAQLAGTMAAGKSHTVRNQLAATRPCIQPSRAPAPFQRVCPPHTATGNGDQYAHNR